jgi:NAD(P)-dependent dehydrogenase (short-subunit alcohol dehydrogenase family)
MTSSVENAAAALGRSLARRRSEPPGRFTGVVDERRRKSRPRHRCGVLAVMRAQRSGAIVNTSSVCGLRATAMTTPDNTSKHGVIGLTQEAALDFAELGIRVNAVLPGVVDTAMARGIAAEEQIEEMGRSTPVGRSPSRRRSRRRLRGCCRTRRPMSPAPAWSSTVA